VGSATLLEVYERLRHVYGEDISQEAYLWTLTQSVTEPVSRLRYNARILWNMGYHDGRLSRAHWHTWDREMVHPSNRVADSGFWMHAPPSPEWLVIAAEALRSVPLWLRRWCEDEDFTPKRLCHLHPPRYWYPYVHGQNRSVRCQQCLADRATAQRQRNAKDHQGRSLVRG
jgi:hypothetical protein